MVEQLLHSVNQLAADLEEGREGAEDRVPDVLGPIHRLTRDEVKPAQLHALQQGVGRVQAALADRRQAVMDAFRAARKKAAHVRRFNNLRSPRTAQRLRKRA